MAPGNSSTRRRGLRVLATLLIVLTACWALGQLTRDANRLTALLFYIPSPVPAALLLVAAAVAVLRRAPRRAALWGLLAAAPIFVVLGVENRFGAAAARPETALVATEHITLVHWNVWEGTLGWRGVVSELLAMHADLYVLSEIPKDLSDDEVISSFGADYRGVVFESIAIVSRDPVELRTATPREDEVIFASAHWHSQLGDIELLAVDLPSSLFFARDPVLRELNALLEKDAPDIVVGDFNAPRRSRALQALPDGYRHAYDVAGRGWSYSWPVPLPVLAIDQCIVGARVAPLSYELHTPWQSDHRLQRLELNLIASP